MNEKLHREMCDFVSSYRDWVGSKNKKLILEPRGSLKSTCVTIAYPLQLILKYPNIRILIDSEKLNNSKAFLSSIKGHIESNEKYRQLSEVLYGKTPQPSDEEKWTASEIVSSLRTDRSIKEPTISCGGVDVVKVGMHYDYIFVDDPVSDNNSATREQIEKVINHYRYLLSLLEPNGKLIIIGTRYDFGDLYGYVIENAGQHFDILIRKAIQSDGTLLYPERLTKEFLEEQRISQGSWIFSNQYQNEPLPREDAPFSWINYHEWTGEYSNGQIMPKELRKYKSEFGYDELEKESTILVNVFMTIDPAVSEAATADYTAIVVCGVDNKNRLFVLDYVNEHIAGKKFWDKIFDMYEKYQPRRFGVETTAFQKSLNYSMKDEMRRRNVFFIFDELKSDENKQRRVLTLQPRYEAGMIFIKKGMEDLRYQLTNFPRTTHDDLIDALAYQMQLIFPKRENKEHIKKHNYRFSITGY
jgi:predicted phage terminase large subunit-like protein